MPNLAGVGVKARRFSKRLEFALSIKGIYKSELAQKIGVSSASVSHYTSGRTLPTKEVMQKISKCIGVSYYWLLGFGEMNMHDMSQKDEYFSDKSITKDGKEIEVENLMETEIREIVNVLYSLNYSELKTVHSFAKGVYREKEV